LLKACAKIDRDSLAWNRIIRTFHSPVALMIQLVARSNLIRYAISTFYNSYAIVSALKSCSSGQMIPQKKGLTCLK
jgi:hypothetical protein